VKKLILLVLLLVVSLLNAKEADLSSTENAFAKVYSEVLQTIIKGPKDIPILQQATLKLPENFGFVPKMEAIKLLQAMGNFNNPNVEGMVLALDEEKDGFFVISYQRSGYIKDDDAKEWNADDLLEAIKEGTKVGNKQRSSMGIPEIEVVGWITPPWYDDQTHKLIWSAELKTKIEMPDVNGINYNTYVLGREGYISLNLVTNKNYIELMKSDAQVLLSAMTFNEGKRYIDFNADTDHVAEYGLATLVAGAAAKKLGFFAMIIAFFIKFWKLAGIALAGLWYTLRGLKKSKVIEEKSEPQKGNHSIVFKSKKRKSTLN